LVWFARKAENPTENLLKSAALRNASSAQQIRFTCAARFDIALTTNSHFGHR
jgi:hypothetical protein